MPLTIAEAARLLEIPEHAVRARLADGSIRVVGKGAYGRKLLDTGDVRSLARAQQLGQLGRRLKLVLVVGSLIEHHHVLRIAGLTPEHCSGMLDALSRHDVPGAPIIVASPAAVNDELHILQPILGQIHLAVVTHSQTTVPWVVEQSATIVEPFELRRLVQWAWRALDLRTEADRLKL